MAINVVSKSDQENPSWASGIYYLSLFLFCFAIFASAILFYLNKRASKKIEALNAQVAQIKPSEAESKLEKSKKRIDDFEGLIKKHKVPSMFLGSAEGPFSQTKKLASLIHPQVQLTSLSINLENSVVTISGITKNFTTLEQQLIIFKQEPLVKEASLSGFSTTKEGKVNFGANLTFDPSVFTSAK